MLYSWLLILSLVAASSQYEGVLATYRSHQSDNRLVLASPRPTRARLSSYGNVGFAFCCYSPPFTGHTICAWKVQLCTQPQRHNTDSDHDISMGKCKKDITPLLTHWSHVFLALTRRFVFVYTKHTVMCLNSWNLKFVNRLYLIPPPWEGGDTHYMREMSRFCSIDPLFQGTGKYIDSWHTPLFQDAGESIDIRPPFSNTFPQTSALHPPPPLYSTWFFPRLWPQLLWYLAGVSTLLSNRLFFHTKAETKWPPFCKRYCKGEGGGILMMWGRWVGSAV